MDKETRLTHIAEAQQGYFTSRQAAECGFSPTNFPRKVAQGKWLKERVRGVYRLASYPMTARPELALWMLWSADKQGRPQGVWSHETALDIHGLSEVSPAKLHMSVPKSFRKATKIPNHICLHYVDVLPQSDLEIRQGYRVTKPLRTLVDIIRDRTTQTEQIERAILDKGIQKSLFKGLVTIREAEQLVACTDSQEMREIILHAIDEVWTHANSKLADFGRSIEPYTIGLALEDQGFSTAVLCEYKGRALLLTAGHVGRAVRKAKSVRMIIRFDHVVRRWPAYSSTSFTVLEWDPTMQKEALKDVLGTHPKDLSIITMPENIVDLLRMFKLFYKLPETPLGLSLQDAFVSMGGIEAVYSKENDTIELHAGPFGFIASSYNQFHDVDYLICPVSNHTYEMRNMRRKAISSFEGLSGSGLWKFIGDSPVLIGIAIAQDDPDVNGGRNVYFHGPQSILAALETLGQCYDNTI